PVPFLPLENENYGRQLVVGRNGPLGQRRGARNGAVIEMGRELKRVLLEALIVAAIGLAVALLANLVSPRGLSLTRNYFPSSGTTHGKIDGSANSNVNPTVPATNGAGRLAREIVAARLREKGLQPIDFGEAMELFR